MPERSGSRGDLLWRGGCSLPFRCDDAHIDHGSETIYIPETLWADQPALHMSAEWELLGHVPPHATLIPQDGHGPQSTAAAVRWDAGTRTFQRVEPDIIINLDDEGWHDEPPLSETQMAQPLATARSLPALPPARRSPPRARRDAELQVVTPVTPPPARRTPGGFVVSSRSPGAKGGDAVCQPLPPDPVARVGRLSNGQVDNDGWCLGSRVTLRRTGSGRLIARPDAAANESSCRPPAIDSLSLEELQREAEAQAEALLALADAELTDSLFGGLLSPPLTPVARCRDAPKPFGGEKAEAGNVAGAAAATPVPGNDLWKEAAESDVAENRSHSTPGAPRSPAGSTGGAVSHHKVKPHGDTGGS